MRFIVRAAGHKVSRLVTEELLGFVYLLESVLIVAEWRGAFELFWFMGWLGKITAVGHRSVIILFKR